MASVPDTSPVSHRSSEAQVVTATVAPGLASGAISITPRPYLVILGEVTSVR
ncbi:MAG: hypothetical protein KGR42_06025 [Acidobacteria bacterium]|nr:hypothetical protein [Acidobacteriota bacterium]